MTRLRDVFKKNAELRVDESVCTVTGFHLAVCCVAPTSHDVQCSMCGLVGDVQDHSDDPVTESVPVRRWMVTSSGVASEYLPVAVITPSPQGWYLTGRKRVFVCFRCHEANVGQRAYSVAAKV